MQFIQVEIQTYWKQFSNGHDLPFMVLSTL